MTQEKIDKKKFLPAEISTGQSERISKPSLNYWQDAWLRVRKNKGCACKFDCPYCTNDYGVSWSTFKWT